MLPISLQEEAEKVIYIVSRVEESLDGLVTSRSGNLGFEERAKSGRN
jgi:hypothetical protein